ncbi:MAG: UPF0280 family protein [Candidatus Nezhaarchaeales archaeon]|nr:MAG: UPF0280 family protein [Candidatus Nezhaarchaeota archaeon WYZ-LMO8]TDA36427.1 MAG: UPF0280 family protein [Candidatus Nezhaarchaeota archaeon WYZ-LMO7]
MKLLRRHYCIKESSGEIICDSTVGLETALTSIAYHRECLENYVRRNLVFKYALSPIGAEDDAPLVVKRMVECSKIANVGPMASVAGVLADLAVEAALKSGARIILVENGGEIAVAGSGEFVIGIRAGSIIPFGLKVKPCDLPIGIATSSGRYGHALSFGEADAVTVIADNAGLADAAATAICNATRGEDAIERGIERAMEIKEIRGVIIVVGDLIGIYGRLPELIEVNCDHLNAKTL